ncbi:MAG: polyhydroxybutyrate depolymerase [Sphingomonadales bacterium]|jgi:polyhydroxybutyrate depolymerase|nr:polyhydroxybutyrate depolymerase [Sphingomonadales bacterium]
MKSRFLVGVATLSAVAITIGGAAVAQRAGRFRQIIQMEQQHRGALPANPNMSPLTAPGDYRFSFVHDGITREYLVHVPRSYKGGRTPMLVALHGGGGDADFQADDSKYKLISKSEAVGFIAVFPNGYSRLGGVLATWNAGACCGAAQKNNVDDVGFLREVIQRVERQANIDRSRVFMTGMSNGALMSWRMACEASELVRGIAPVEGTDNTAHCTPSRPVPVIEFHSLDDDHIPISGGKGVSALTDTDFASVPSTQAKWVQLNRADPNAKRVLTVAGAHCDLHAAKPGGAPVELCLTDTGGHSWPGSGTQQGRKAPSMAISANDLMWSFFSSL